MASRIEFAVSATPVASVSAGENVAVDTIAADIKKSLGGSASVETTHNTTGYASGAAAYDEAEVSGGTASTLGSAGYDFVFIKHTGFKYSAADKLGEAVTSTTDVSVTIGSQIICVLPPGGAIVLPNVPAADIKVISDSATENVAVEFILST